MRNQAPPPFQTLIYTRLARKKTQLINTEVISTFLPVALQFTEKIYAPINSQVQHPPWAFELLKIGLFNFPPLGAKEPFKCPTN